MSDQMAEKILTDACELYCRWYDTGEPQVGAGAMTYMLVSGIRQALQALKEETQNEDCLPSQ